MAEERPKHITQAQSAEQGRKALLTKVHRVIDAHEDGRNAESCMVEIRQILGRAGTVPV